MKRHVLSLWRASRVMERTHANFPFLLDLIDEHFQQDGLRAAMTAYLFNEGSSFVDDPNNITFWGITQKSSTALLGRDTSSLNLYDVAPFYELLFSNMKLTIVPKAMIIPIVDVFCHYGWTSRASALRSAGFIQFKGERNSTFVSRITRRGFRPLPTTCSATTLMTHPEFKNRNKRIIEFTKNFLYG